MAHLSKKLLPYFVLQMREQFYKNLSLSEAKGYLLPRYSGDYPEEVIKTWERDTTEWKDAIPRKEREELLKQYHAA